MASIWTRAVVAGLLWVGCGGDDDGACAESASVSGSVAGQMIDPVASVWTEVSADFPYATLLVLDEDTSGCDLEEGTGTGEHLVLVFCAPPSAGEYDVVTLDDFPEESCPAQLIASANIEDENGGDLDQVESGTVTIDAAGDCLSGTFSLSFTTGDLSGDFSAVVCR